MHRKHFFCILKKDFAKSRSQISTKYLQPDYITLFRIMIFCREVQYYSMLSAYREQHISEQDYENSVVLEIHISKLEPQRWSPEFFLMYLGLGIEVVSFLLGSCDPNLN